MNRWEIFPSLLIGTTRRISIYTYVLLLAAFCQHSVAWEKMHFTWFSRRDGFSPTRHQILPSTLRGSGQDTVSSWEKTPSLLENHVECISYHALSRSWSEESRETGILEIMAKCSSTSDPVMTFLNLHKDDFI